MVSRLRRLFFVILFVCSFPGVYIPALARPAVPAYDIYTDDLAPGWDNWSWATVDLQSTAQAHAGSRSIAVTFSGWSGLYLHYPDLSTLGYTDLRFFIHGGSSGGQQINVFAASPLNGEDVNGPSVAVPPPAANAWSEVRISLADLGVADKSLSALTWQGSSDSLQATLYIDDIALVSDESPDGPTLSAGYLLPRAVPADGSSQSVVRVKIGDPQGLGDIAGVTLDGSALGWGEITLYDNGRSNDGAAADGVYGTTLTVAPGTPSGEHMLLVTALDKAGHQASLSLGAFVILAAVNDGEIPTVLPQRLGWGSNAWDYDPATDWQVQSGVPWDYVYQYITYGWNDGSWGENFVQRFVSQAWDKGYVPLISVYVMLGLPPTCGESPTCYAEKLQNAGAVSDYLSDLQQAALEAKGDHPVIFHLEPDFYGYMQKLTNEEDPPVGLRVDDPTSYPVALNVSGYANNLAGFGQYMVDLIHSTAPNALVAPGVSMWGTNGDPNSASVTDVISMGQRTAAFVNAMGGTRADLFVTDWSDRDAGSGLRPWWDDTDLALPRHTRAILWDNAVSAAAHKRLILWQLPVGNMSLDNTCDHYQDNHAAYVFNHPGDLFDAGIFAVLFGGGADCMTNVTTDGGFVAEQGAIAYAKPPAPSSPAPGGVIGSSVSVYWNESSEPDLAGYRVSYQRASGGAVITIDAGRKNSLQLILPEAGAWRIWVSTYDVMGQVGPASNTIQVTTAVSAELIYLPLTQR